MKALICAEMFESQVTGKSKNESFDPRQNAFVFRCKLLNDRFPRSFIVKKLEKSKNESLDLQVK